MINFPNYSQEALSKLIRVEFNLKKFNCDKDDFINSQLRMDKNDSPVSKRSRGFQEKRTSVTQIGGGLGLLSTRMYDKP